MAAASGRPRRERPPQNGAAGRSSQSRGWERVTWPGGAHHLARAWVCGLWRHFRVAGRDVPGGGVEAGSARAEVTFRVPVAMATRAAAWRSGNGAEAGDRGTGELRNRVNYVKIKQLYLLKPRMEEWRLAYLH